MKQLGEMTYRLAEPPDVFPIIQFYQTVRPENHSDPVFFDSRTLSKELIIQNSFWILMEHRGSLVGVVQILTDPANGLGKLHRIHLDFNIGKRTDILKEAFKITIEFLSSEKRAIEVLYTNTVNLSFREQKAIEELGFKVVGIFPDVGFHKSESVSGLLAYFFDGVLEKKRLQPRVIHKKLEKFYEATKRECLLLDTPKIALDVEKVEGMEAVPDLEVIFAPGFVRHRYELLKSKRSSAVHFFPFVEPNLLILNASDEINVFVMHDRKNQFAVIIGDRIQTSVDPVTLYLKVCSLLSQQGVEYIEIICDAEDVQAIDCLMETGFIPTAYFPALKKQPSGRRDYVVMIRSYQLICGLRQDNLELSKRYLKYLEAYHEIEGERFFHLRQAGGALR